MGIFSLINSFTIPSLNYVCTGYYLFLKHFNEIRFLQVRIKIGNPITGYGSESRNRAARQRIPNKVWKDEDGVEHIMVLLSFHYHLSGTSKHEKTMFD